MSWAAATITSWKAHAITVVKSTALQNAMPK